MFLEIFWDKCQPQICQAVYVCASYLKVKFKGKYV